MHCCSTGKSPAHSKDNMHHGVAENDDVKFKCVRTFDQSTSSLPYIWFPALNNVKQIEYVNKVENDFICLQKAFLALTTHFARLQFRLRQIMDAAPEERDALLIDLEKIAFEGIEENGITDEIPNMHRDYRAMGDIRRRQSSIIYNLRRQLCSLREAAELQGEVSDDEEFSRGSSSIR